MPDIHEDYEFTLVLDLDETLIHYIESSVNNNETGHFLVRPGAREFLNKMKAHYQIVIFTAAV